VPTAASIPRQNSTGSSSISSGSANIGAYNAMTRTTSAGPGHAMPRSVSVSESPYSSPSPCHLPQRPMDADPYSASSRGGQYTPIRPHSRPQHYPPPPSEYSDLPKGHTPPVPPPRRSRPMSAGPLQSSTNSAFSVPPQRSISPEQSRATSMPPEPEYQDVRPKIMSRPDSHLGRSSSGRVLPQPPSSSANSQPRPGSTPLRPNNKDSNPPAPRKSSVWYEYGCL
jgi:hypothetical protein